MPLHPVGMLVQDQRMKRPAELLQEGEGNMVKVSRAIEGDARAHGPGALVKPAAKAIEGSESCKPGGLAVPTRRAATQRTAGSCEQSGLSRQTRHPGQERRIPAFLSNPQIRYDPRDPHKLNVALSGCIRLTRAGAVKKFARGPNKSLNSTTSTLTRVSWMSLTFLGILVPCLMAQAPVTGSSSAAIASYLCQPAYARDWELRGPMQSYVLQPGDIFLATDQRLWFRWGHLIAGANGVHHSGIVFGGPTGGWG